jgi:hypothetical protein
MKRILTFVLLAAVLLAVTAPAIPAAAQNGNTWQIYYFNNPNWQGNAAFVATSSAVNFNWGSDTAPAPNMPSQNWTARVVSTVYFYSGIYTFQMQADDELALYIDSVLYADTRGANQPGRSLTIDIPLTQGNHYIDIEYRQYTGPAYLYVTWTYLKGNPGPPPPPGPTPAPPPSTPNQLFPPPSNLVTQYGNYTSCAQQQIHQSNCFVSNGAWNAPNMGSITGEPQILRWMNCTADSVQYIQLYTNQPAQSAKCSKTEAGFFPN